MGHLKSLHRSFLGNALAPNTRETYLAGWGAYTSFCSQIHSPSLPLQEKILELFVSSLAYRLATSSIRTYLSGVQYVSNLQGYYTNISKMQRLRYTLLGIQRVTVGTFKGHERLPMLPSHLSKFFRFLDVKFQTRDAYMLKAASSLAFFGLLRSSEYTSPGKHVWNPGHHLSVGDVSFPSHGRMGVRIKQSKTDQFREGCTVNLVRMHSHLCPVENMVEYLKVRGYGQGPLFLFSSGTFLTRGELASLLQTGVPGAGLNTHSFRAGGATALASAGLSPLVIKQLGRWKSSAFCRYVNFPEGVTDSAYRALRNTLDSEDSTSLGYS